MPDVNERTNPFMIDDVFASLLRMISRWRSPRWSVAQGLDRVESQRFVSCMTITLSNDPIDTTNKGYQPPLPMEEINPGDSRPDAHASAETN